MGYSSRDRCPRSRMTTFLQLQHCANHSLTGRSLRSRPAMALAAPALLVGGFASVATSAGSRASATVRLNREARRFVGPLDPHRLDPDRLVPRGGTFSALSTSPPAEPHRRSRLS